MSIATATAKQHIVTFISVRVRSVCTQHLFSRSGYQLCLAKCFQAERSCQPFWGWTRAGQHHWQRAPFYLPGAEQEGWAEHLPLSWVKLHMQHLGMAGSVAPRAKGDQGLSPAGYRWRAYCVPNLQLDGRGCVAHLCRYIWESGSWWQWGHVERDIVGMWLGMLSRNQVSLRDCSCRWLTLGQRQGVMEKSKWHGGELGRKVMPNLLFHPLLHPRAECSAGQNWGNVTWGGWEGEELDLDWASGKRKGLSSSFF